MSLGALSLAGCAVPATVVLTAAAPVAQAGTAAYISNELVYAFSLPIGEVQAAVDAANRALALTPTVRRPSTAADGTLTKLYIASESLDQTPIEIRLEAITPALTRIQIRYGFWGDQAVSRAILTKIEQFARIDEGTRGVQPSIGNLVE
ncbi:MAG: DUF3568 domain-containing protein [Phycisphaerales bacterium]|nr:DUF3568 domain-containing protein [Phycisphaerales bacterium]